MAGSGTQRLALGVAYDGRRWQGWQSQPGGRTVQDRLEQALAAFATVPVRTVCAGRTDAGVHALNQVVHFDAPVRRDDFSWVRGVNRYLDADIAVQWCREMPPDFHARNSARGRRYRYLLLESPVRPALEAGRCGWTFRPLDGPAMQQAAQHLLGEHDFSAFRSSQCQARSPVRRLERLAIGERDGLLMIDVCANAFLHHMVRNLVGALVWVGMGRRPVGWLGEVLASRDRRLAAPTMAAQGLYLSGVEYGDAWPTGTWPPIPVPF